MDTEQTTPQPHPQHAPAATKLPWYKRPVPVACSAAGLTLAVVAAVGIPVTASALEAASSSTTVVAAPDTSDSGSSGSSGRGGTSTQTPYGESSGPSTGTEDGGGTTQESSTSVEDATEADADESTGIVIIETVLGYSDGAAAGTGIVLTSDGLVLTNNHVVEGSTEISVTIGTTGETYTATVVGTDDENDVAVLQLEGASGLTVGTIDEDDEEAVGDLVTAVGNAEGGGVLMAADGEISELDATVTTSAEGYVDAETLEGMIEVVADVVSGDSGGALLDDEGEIIGMTTAASVGGTITVGYAIPIDDALEIVDQILAGDDSGSVTIGYPAFLGVSLSAESTSTSDSSGATSQGGFGQGSYGQGGYGQQSTDGSTTETTSGATIAGVIDGTPAAEIGLAAGDTITAVDGTSVADGDELSEILSEYEPDDSVTITWTDSSGATQSATTVLIEGPAA